LPSLEVIEAELIAGKHSGEQQGGDQQQDQDGTSGLGHGAALVAVVDGVNAATRPESRVVETGADT
jgi:hypothetical protein